MRKLLYVTPLLAVFHGVTVQARGPADAGAPADGREVPELLVTAEAMPGYKADAATVAGKVPLAPREVPNSLSVLTRQQMDDQELVTMSDALRQITGVTVIANDTTNDQVMARGYSLGAMYDGVPSYAGLTAVQQFDLAMYERVEVLRGPAGVLQGSGEPGGVVNMVRKRPGAVFALSGTLAAGSWNNYRSEVDVTGPLNADRSLRGRLVVSGQDREYFQDRTHTGKWLVFGTLEYDLQPATTLALSASIQNDNTTAPSSGLPLYTDARLLDADRSTNVYPDWVNYHIRTEEVSASIEHRFDNRWVARAALNHRSQHSDSKDAWPGSGVDPLTGTFSRFNRSQSESDYDRDGLDLYLNGPFALLGRSHNLMLGFNVDRRKSASKSGSAPAVPNVVFGQPDSVPEASIRYTSGSETVTSQHGPYGQLRASLADPLTLVLGGRTTTFRTRSRNVSPSVPTDWSTGNARADNHFTPYGGLLLDVSRDVTLYGSYADIFVPQTQKKADGSVIDPRTGRQYELGAKGDFLDGRLGATLALFTLRDRNRAYRDPDYPASSTPYYLASGEIESRGWEAELTGSPLRGLDLTAGYTRLMTRYVKDRSLEGKAYSIQTPSHQFKLWADYRFSEDSLPGFSLGGGVQANSGSESSRGNRAVQGQGGYAVFNARAAFRLDRHFTVGVLVNNVFDRKYYASVGTSTAYNFYGEPRNVMLTLRGSY